MLTTNNSNISNTLEIFKKKGEIYVKVIFAIINDEDSMRLIEQLNEKKIGVTKLASSGGFLKRGNTTLIIGVEENKLDEVLDIIKQNCKSRKQMIVPNSIGFSSGYVPYPIEITVGGATIFVLDVERFVKNEG